MTSAAPTARCGEPAVVADLPLLPATQIFGDGNWYSLFWLEWMPRIRTEYRRCQDLPRLPPVPVA